MVILCTHHLVLDSCSARAPAASKDDLIVRDKSNGVDWEGFERVGNVLCAHVDGGNDESDRVGGGNVGTELGLPVCVCRVNPAPRPPPASLQTTMDGPLGDGSEIQLPLLDKRTVIGVSVAIAGNVFISLALNLQKLSHRRRDLAAAQTEGKKPQQDRDDAPRLPNPPMERVRELSYEDMEDGWPDVVEGELDTIRTPRLETLQPESEPLLPRVSSRGSTSGTAAKKRGSLFRLLLPGRPPHSARPSPTTPTRRQVPVRPPPMSRGNSATTSSSSIVSNGNETDYLKSKLW